ncbi:hypothetical protein GOHSU_20_00100 [Gordonia hirsuta DSM 44140 = NBRC 16056]|uniref:DUF1707 domain-containing protein n=1 Tax=Gordonia hirsuta DSM 44140 = NBRC 16056 TaxID=1121927 RepID=L7LBT5_9ACTN|nr:DUF1707 domain-containing protein [Gordonia hirsuta]GAC57473.1 hypothetical protein GOHSU_20_00100 [Gordonia hirsuta DSM 44140 = NBRC 16056]
MTEPEGGNYYPAPLDDARRGQIRADNADRMRADAFLSAAMTVGALTPEEYSERAGEALAATSLAQLDALLADLPLDRLGGAVAESTAGQTRVSTSGAAPVARTAGILSGSELSGGAVVGSDLKATAFLGGVDIDLREVEFTAPVLEIRCKAMMGGIRIVVPSDVTVEVHGSGVGGSFSGAGAGPGRAGAPRVVIRGVAFLGGVEVTRVARGAETGPRRPN